MCHGHGENSWEPCWELVQFNVITFQWKEHVSWVVNECIICGSFFFGQGSFLNIWFQRQVGYIFVFLPCRCVFTAPGEVQGLLSVSTQAWRVGQGRQWALTDWSISGLAAPSPRYACLIWHADNEAASSRKQTLGSTGIQWFIVKRWSSEAWTKARNCCSQVKKLNGSNLQAWATCIPFSFRKAKALT